MASLDGGSEVSSHPADDIQTDNNSKNQHIATDTNVCALLLVIAEPLNVEQKDLILERIVTELSNWDSELSGYNLSQQIQSIQTFQPSIQNGIKSFKETIGALNVSIIIGASLEVAEEEVLSFLQTPSKYKFLLHSGPVLLNSGAWLLKDGLFTFQHLSQVLKKPQVIEALSKQSDTLIDLSCVQPSNEWTEATFAKLHPKLKIRLSRPTRTLSDESGLIKFSDHVSTFLSTPSLNERLPTSTYTGSVAFEQPTAYVFPAGQGDCFLFGVAGFSILINGGYSKTSCFHNLVRHLPRLDVVLVTRLTADNLLGLSAFFERHALERMSQPSIGAVMLNVGDARHKQTPTVEHTTEHPRSTSGLIVSVAEEGRLVAEHLSLLNLLPSSHVGESFVNLYYKVGHGSLDMYVISPQLDSKEFKDFLHNWAKAVDSYKGGIPVSNNLSIACAMIWRPATHLKEKNVRMLFPGNIAPSRLHEGLDRLKNVAFFQTLSGVEKPLAKKPLSATRQAPSRVGVRKADLPTKAPSSASLEKNRDARRVPVSAEVKKVGPTARKTNSVRSSPKPKSESPSNDVKDVKDGEGKEAKGAKAVENKDGVVAKVSENKARKKDSKFISSTKNSTQRTPGKALKGNEPAKDETKSSARVPKQSDRTTPLAKKSPKPAQHVKTPSSQSKPSEAPKSGTKSAEKAKTPRSTEKAKAIEKRKSPEKKESPSETKTPKKLEAKIPEKKKEKNHEKEEEKSAEKQVEKSLEKREEKILEKQDEKSIEKQEEKSLEEQEEKIIGKKEETSEEKKDISEIPEVNGLIELDDNTKVEGKVENVDEAQTFADKQDVPADSLSEKEREKVLEDKEVEEDKQAACDPILSSAEKGSEEFDPTKEWGAPLHLPSPAKESSSAAEVEVKNVDEVRAGGRRRPPSHEDLKSATKTSRLSKAAPKASVAPFHVELAYVPACADVDFFRRVRSHFYVLSCATPDAQVLPSLLEAKAEWQDSGADVVVVPTQQSKVLLSWLAALEPQLQAANVKLAPPASLCSVDIHPPESACDAYRIPFN